MKQVRRQHVKSLVVLFVEVSFQRSFEGVRGLSVTQGSDFHCFVAQQEK